MEVTSIQDGIIIDHVPAGTALKVLQYLKIDPSKTRLALIMNTDSPRYGTKDIIKIENVEGIDLDVLGLVARQATVDIVRDRVLGHPVDTRDAVLHGYSKVCGWDYLTLVPSDSSVRGVVFEADVDDVARMDVWEDVPVYSLVPVTVETDDGPAEAHTYIMGTPPEHYEIVDDSCVAAIPILEIMADLDRMLGRRRRGLRSRF